MTQAEYIKMYEELVLKSLRNKNKDNQSAEPKTIKHKK
tara:strand:- start:155 stop:268 length:114 start_codon:yes stop_codon:yes gene_type:complete